MRMQRNTRKNEIRQATNTSPSDRTMNKTHVIINTLALGECGQTLPTYMGLTARACHVVTALATFNRHPANRTALDIVIRSPLREQLVVRYVPLITRQPVMILDVTRGADAEETGRTLEDSIPRCRSVYLGTVWSGAMVELVGPTADVCPKGGFSDSVEFACRQQFTGKAKGYGFSAHCVVSQAREREVLVVHRGR